MKQQQVKKKPRNNYLTPSIIIGCIALPLLLWYQFTNSIMEKILIIFTFVTIIVPLSIGMINICIGTIITPHKTTPNNNNYKQSRIEPMQKGNTNYNRDYSNIGKNVFNVKKGGIGNPSEYYKIVRNSLIVYFKESVLTREDILYFKQCLDSRLGNRLSVYSNFRFENEANEIYTKLKSSMLKDDDYRYLIDVLNEIIQSKNII